MVSAYNKWPEKVKKKTQVGAQKMAYQVTEPSTRAKGFVKFLIM